MNSRRIFIGSSTEALPWANAISSALQSSAVPTVWPHIFDPSAYPLESLVEAFDQSDYGLFVFCPDDVTLMRGTTNLTVRDNVILEFGISLGKVGRRRTYFLLPEGIEMHLPTDLVGLNGLYYDSSKVNHNDAVFAASRRILDTMVKLEGSNTKLPLVNNTSSRQEVKAAFRFGEFVDPSSLQKFTGLDAKNVLEDWLQRNAPVGATINVHFDDLDRDLNFESGEARKIVGSATASLGFKVVSVGERTARIENPFLPFA